jgi:hypothetical protein
MSHQRQSFRQFAVEAESRRNGAHLRDFQRMRQSVAEMVRVVVKTCVLASRRRKARA